MELLELLPKHHSDSPVDWVPATSQSQEAAVVVARNILSDIMQFRRFSGPTSECLQHHCRQCTEPHLSKITSAVIKGQPIQFVLPAFPGKSPNPAKVLGVLPDMAEKCALEFLQHLCDRIKLLHSPGAEIILCSDGRVFSDVVGMGDEDITAYQKELAHLIERLDLSSLSLFNLEEEYSELNFDQMRTQLMNQFGEPVETLQASVRRGKESDCSNEDKESHRLYLGITRFLLEDSMFPGQSQSRSALQKESRNRAFKVIQRSKAWGELIEQKFPEAVRLSIHPQSCGGKKLGIRLIEPDHWQTPWHGVAVYVEGRYILLKRSQAEALGGQLIRRFGRPSHFVLKSKNSLSKLLGKSDEVE